ncbi:hydroxyacylglutathione hydrolase [Chitinibacter sp. S2-10]|uniref:hydroxyacylglutathione hydrolase n=1 Tax=Chitinibacter sp. S2-10 TaxID=3373597 RepID=UPI003977B6FD
MINCGSHGQIREWLIMLNIINISAVPTYEDNYIWVIHQNGKAIAVDPGDAAPLLDWLARNELQLAGILITHHHWDHITGLAALTQANLSQQAQLPVYGPEQIAHINRPLRGGETLNLLGENFSVMATPGHTLDHLSYYGAGILLCGDTLFSSGCGRLFEGTAEQMFNSLQTLAQLPAETLVCCTHEYTQSNLRFALQIEPDNPALQARATQVAQLRERGEPSLPSTLAIELASNPFLRCDQATVRAKVQQHAGIDFQAESSVEVFTELRKWKDHFR